VPRSTSKRAASRASGCAGDGSWSTSSPEKEGAPHADQQQKKKAGRGRRGPSPSSKLGALARVEADGDGRADTSSSSLASPRDGTVVEKNVRREPGGRAGFRRDDPSSSRTISSVLVVADLFEDEATEVREGAAGRGSRCPAVAARARPRHVDSRVGDRRSPRATPCRPRGAPRTDGILRPNAYATLRFSTEADRAAVAGPRDGDRLRRRAPARLRAVMIGRSLRPPRRRHRDRRGAGR
jgi:hypothetical protein